MGTKILEQVSGKALDQKIVGVVGAVGLEPTTSRLSSVTFYKNAALPIELYPRPASVLNGHIRCSFG